jgi:hypothetical protein
MGALKNQRSDGSLGQPPVGGPASNSTLAALNGLLSQAFRGTTMEDIEEIARFEIARTIFSEHLEMLPRFGSMCTGSR